MELVPDAGRKLKPKIRAKSIALKAVAWPAVKDSNPRSIGRASSVKISFGRRLKDSCFAAQVVAVSGDTRSGEKKRKT